MPMEVAAVSNRVWGGEPAIIPRLIIVHGNVTLLINLPSNSSLVGAWLQIIGALLEYIWFVEQLLLQVASSA